MTAQLMWSATPWCPLRRTEGRCGSPGTEGRPRSKCGFQVDRVWPDPVQRLRCPQRWLTDLHVAGERYRICVNDRLLQREYGYASSPQWSVLIGLTATEGWTPFRPLTRQPLANTFSQRPYADTRVLP